MDTTQPSLLLRVCDPADQTAWREFDTRYRDLILRYCRRLNLQATDAEDVRQMVMLSLTKALPHFEYSPQVGRFRSYLYKTIRNAVFQLYRRPNHADQTLDTVVLATVPHADGSNETDAAWEQEWIHHHYRLAMSTVRQTYEARSVQVFDRLLAGDTVAVVADTFQLSTQAVHKIKQRIRDRLKELIAAQIAEEDLWSHSITGVLSAHGQAESGNG
ncbi:MAG: hypothetical protein HJJLKODD_02771 [Phycisphaerae bacterium]|nr:hypothetical protein [Phycisphaerae bacterium]